jgi:hypothetical protein
MKKINVTFSLPPETHKGLQNLIGRKKMSAFVTNIINKALEEKKAELKHAYIEAAQDLNEKETFEEWSTTDSGDWEW